MPGHAMDSSAATSTYRPASYAAAMAVACATFPLIWVGGLVTTYDAGMAVPDWPATFGYNLFLYPWESWIAGPWDLFIEHGHRLLGSLVGLLTIGLVLVCWRDSRRWLRVAALGALIGVILQGILGGQRVLLNDQRIAQLHGCVGPLFFAFVVMLTTLTSRWWICPFGMANGLPGASARPSKIPPAGAAGHRQNAAGPGGLDQLVHRTANGAWLVFGLAVVQLILGSQLRHGIAYASAGVFRAALLFHIGLACALTFQLTWVGIQTVRTRVGWRLGVVLILLVGCQLLLGLGTWCVKYGWPTLLDDVLAIPGFTVVAESMFQSLVVTGHVATGSLILGLSGNLALRLTRMLWLVRQENHAMLPEGNPLVASNGGMLATKRDTTPVDQTQRENGTLPMDGKRPVTAVDTSDVISRSALGVS